MLKNFVSYLEGELAPSFMSSGIEKLDFDEVRRFVLIIL
jgi:hypothetical protein